MKIIIDKKKFLESLTTLDSNIVLEITNIEELGSMIPNIVNSITQVSTIKPKVKETREVKIKKWGLTNSAITLLGSDDFEGAKSKMYPDEGGLPTIGVGHLLTTSELNSGIIEINGEAIHWQNGLTEIQIIDLCYQDLYKYELEVNQDIDVDLNQNQYTALVFLCFNIGVNGFRGSTVVRVLNKGEYDKVPDAMRMWNKVSKDGRLIVSQGLINRREKEIKIWNGEYNV